MRKEAFERSKTVLQSKSRSSSPTHMNRSDNQSSHTVSSDHPIDPNGVSCSNPPKPELDNMNSTADTDYHSVVFPGLFRAERSPGLAVADKEAHVLFPLASEDLSEVSSNQEDGAAPTSSSSRLGVGNAAAAAVALSFPISRYSALQTGPNSQSATASTSFKSYHLEENNRVSSKIGDIVRGDMKGDLALQLLNSPPLKNRTSQSSVLEKIRPQSFRIGSTVGLGLSGPVSRSRASTLASVRPVLDLEKGSTIITATQRHNRAILSPQVCISAS